MQSSTQSGSVRHNGHDAGQDEADQIDGQPPRVMASRMVKAVRTRVWASAVVSDVGIRTVAASTKRRAQSVRCSAIDSATAQMSRSRHRARRPCRGPAVRLRPGHATGRWPSAETAKPTAEGTSSTETDAASE
jgi:hypothetical protein